MTGVFTQLIICPVLIGRELQVAALQSLIGETIGNSARIALIAGEAGMGKSRLLAEAGTYAAARGLQVLQGNCFPESSSSPYAPLIELVRSRLATCSPETVASQVGPFTRELFPLLPGLIPPPANPRLSLALEPEQERQRLLAALAHCLIPHNEQAPLLLIIEDLHWCDEGSFNALLYLLRRAADQPLLLIGTYRSDEVDSALRGWLAQLDRARLVHELFLAQLTRDEVAAMLEAIFGAGCPVRTEFLDAIYTLAEGNPFYIEELLKSLVAADEIAYVNGAWDCKPGGELHIPRSLQDAVQRRVAHLSSAARKVLTLAAVVGRRFAFELLQHLEPVSEVELLQLIKEMVAAHLVIEESSDQFAFRHALTQQAIYTELLGRERTALHRAVGEAIEQVYADV